RPGPDLGPDRAAHRGGPGPPGRPARAHGARTRRAVRPGLFPARQGTGFTCVDALAGALRQERGAKALALGRNLPYACRVPDDRRSGQVTTSFVVEAPIV